MIIERVTRRPPTGDYERVTVVFADGEQRTEKRFSLPPLYAEETFKWWATEAWRDLEYMKSVRVRPD